MNIVDSRVADVIQLFARNSGLYHDKKDIHIAQQVTKLQVYMLVKKFQHCMMVRWQSGQLLQPVSSAGVIGSFIFNQGWGENC
jgi:hypothetical protein